MAINTNLQIHGLISGMDTETMVKDLMKIEQMKVDRVQQKKQILEWQRDNYRDINTKLLALRNSAFDMKLQGTFQVKKADSSDETALSATATAAAAVANYSVNVISLATGVNKGSSSAVSVGDKGNLASQFGLSGTITFSLTGYDGTNEKTKDFTFDTASKSINDLISEINNANLGITASYDANVDRFFLATTSTGANYKIKATGDNAATFFNDKLKLNLDMTNGNTGTNAKIDFNGAAGLEFSSNQFTVSGINFNLKKAGTSATLLVQNDIDAVITKIKAFVDSYNTAMDAIGSKLGEKRYRDYPPLTAEQKKEMEEADIKAWEEKAKSGLLQGDYLTMSVYNDIRSSAMGMVDGLPAGSKYTSLSSIGINTSENWKDNGKLYVNEDDLRKALTTDLEGVMNLFTQQASDGTSQGIAGKVYDSINSGISDIVAKAGSNTGYYDNSSMGKQITDIDDQISDMQDRMEIIEARYWKQFDAMESALQMMNSQSLWLSQQFSSSSNS